MATNKEKQMIKIFNRRERRERREDILFIEKTFNAKIAKKAKVAKRARKSY